jgi:hypothetical protein
VGTTLAPHPHRKRDQSAVTEPNGPLPPAFYATVTNRHRRAWADWWVLLHPPYTLWHLSYVCIGATLSPHFDGLRLIATVLAFFLAVGIGAHTLDELHGRPLRTSIPSPILATVAIVSIAGAVTFGIVGIHRIGAGLAIFIAIGVLLNCSYNLELFHGLLHNDLTFAAAWGAFPVLTAYYAQATTLRPAALAAGIFAFWLSAAQRALSTPARTLRRDVDTIHGTMNRADGTVTPISRAALLKPIETALKAMTWAIVALAIALILDRSFQG